MDQHADLLDQEKNFFTTGILPQYNYRFVLAKNSSIAQEVGTRHGASPQVSALMGEAMMGAFFLSTHATKENDITISLHMEFLNPPKRIIAFAYSNGGMRAYPVVADARWEEGRPPWAESPGILLVNRWVGTARKLYSSHTELRNVPLEKNLEEFLGRSEQIQSFIKIRSSLSEKGEPTVSGYMFQALPGATADDTDAVLDVIQNNVPEKILESLLSTRQERREGLDDSLPILGAKIHRIGAFHHYCDCNREKISRLITGLHRDEIDSILRDEGVFEATCEFCKKNYRFSAEEIEKIGKGE